MKYPILLVTLLLCIPNFCAEHQNIQALMNASPDTLEKMDLQSLERMHRVLASHLEDTREDFLEQPLFLGISRRNVQYLGNIAGIFCMAQGFGQEGIKINAESYTAEQDIASGRREADTCSLYDNPDIMPLRFLTGFFTGLICFGIGAKITRLPAEDRLKQNRLHTLARILEAKKKARDTMLS